MGQRGKEGLKKKHARKKTFTVSSKGTVPTRALAAAKGCTSLPSLFKMLGHS